MTRLLSTLFFCLPVAAFAASPIAPPTPPLSDPPIRFLADLKASEAEVGKALDLLGTNPDDVAFRKILSEHSSGIQRLGTLRSFVGDDVGALAAFDALRRSKKDVTPAERLIIADAKAEDAILEIVREAKHRQIVILNEAHHVPLHRAFALKLARELRKIGYTHLAVETLSTYGTSPLDDGYVKKQSGYYSKELVFAQFLTEAKAAGWILVPYESVSPDQSLSMEGRMLAREVGQAQNLMARIFVGQPSAKTFIYVGYSHGAKTPLPVRGGEMEWMAAQLRKLTGLDPLSIDQTNVRESVNAVSGESVYGAVTKQHLQTAPFVLKKKSGGHAVFGESPGAFDMQVFHPPTTRIYGRAAWLQTLADRRPFDISAHLLTSTQRRLIYAFSESDPVDAAPIDVVIVEPGKPVPKLMLPAGKFRFEYEE